jgi:hypothetical protein
VVIFGLPLVFSFAMRKTKPRNSGYKNIVLAPKNAVYSVYSEEEGGNAVDSKVSVVSSILLC